MKLGFGFGLGARLRSTATQAYLNALALDDTDVPEDASATINITGASSGSTITVQTGAVPAGMSLNSGARTISGTPTTQETANFTLRETHADGSNSPRDTSLSITISAAAGPDLDIFSSATDASATPTTVVLTLESTITGFRVWSGQPAALGEGEWLLYVKKNSDAVFAVAMERYWGRILHAAPGDTFAFGTSDGRTLQFAQMVVPTSLIVPSGATGTANCDEALPLIWEPTAPHITLPGNGSAFQIDADGTARWVFIAERDADNVWSPPRAVRISDTRDTIIQCNFAAIAIANEAGATLAITAPTGSTIGGTKGVMSLDTIPAVTGTTHSVSTMAQLKTAIANAVSGDAIAASTASYALDVAITDASFVANEALGNQGAEGILIYGTSGDRDDVIFTGNGTSTNGSWTLTQGGASDFTTFRDLTFDFASQAIKFTASGGKFNFQNVLGKGGTGTDIFSFNNTAGALTVKALHTQLQDGAGDLWNFDGDATYNAASLVDMIGCSGLSPGPSNNSYQCATTHHDLPIRVHGGLWSDAHLNVFANGNATSSTYAEFATITKGARTSGIANTHLYCCDWEVNPATTGNSTLLAAIGNHVTGAKDSTSYGTFRNCPIVERNVIAVTSGRGVHNSIEADINGNIIIGADTAIRNGDAASLMASSNINFNTLVSNTTGLNHPTTTNDPAVFNSNAAKTNTTSVNTTAGAKTSLTGDYNVLDATVDADYVAGANDTTGTDAALDSDYFPTASGNCDDNGDYSKLGHVGGADPFGFVLSYKQNVAPRGARSRPIIRSGAELYPDIW